jgi:hypothetical protein
VTATGEVFDDLAALPAPCAELFAAGIGRDFHLGLPWFRAVLAGAMPAGSRGLFLWCHSGDGPGVLFALRTRADGRAEPLICLYSCLYQPLALPRAGADELRAAGQVLGEFCRRQGGLRLDALDADWPGWPPLLEGVRAAGLVALRFEHFANHYLPVVGRTWADYLATRPGELRETIRRRLGQAGRDPRIALETIGFPSGASPAGLEAGIAAYEQVHARSWKQPEPFPRFGAELMRQAAAAGSLRLGVLRLDGRPIAAQYWVMAGRVATVLKLAHDEAERARSPGTVLTAAMIRGLLERENIEELDFGRGDDAYKSLWTGCRRQRIGFVLANPWRARGLAALVRHRLGRVVRHWRGK